MSHVLFDRGGNQFVQDIENFALGSGDHLLLRLGGQRNEFVDRDLRVVGRRQLAGFVTGVIRRVFKLTDAILINTPAPLARKCWVAS